MFIKYLFLIFSLGFSGLVHAEGHCSPNTIGRDMLIVNQAIQRMDQIDRYYDQDEYELALELVRSWRREFHPDRPITLSSCSHDPRVITMSQRWSEVQTRFYKATQRPQKSSASLCERIKKEVVETYEQAINLYEQEGLESALTHFVKSARLADHALHAGECDREERTMLTNIARYAWKAASF